MAQVRPTPTKVSRKEPVLIEELQPVTPKKKSKKPKAKSIPEKVSGSTSKNASMHSRSVVGRGSHATPTHHLAVTMHVNENDLVSMAQLSLLEDTYFHRCSLSYCNSLVIGAGILPPSMSQSQATGDGSLQKAQWAVGIVGNDIYEHRKKQQSAANEQRRAAGLSPIRSLSMSETDPTRWTCDRCGEPTPLDILVCGNCKHPKPTPTPADEKELMSPLVQQLMLTSPSSDDDYEEHQPSDIGAAMLPPVPQSSSSSSSSSVNVEKFNTQIARRQAARPPPRVPPFPPATPPPTAYPPTTPPPLAPQEVQRSGYLAPAFHEFPVGVNPVYIPPPDPGDLQSMGRDADLVRGCIVGEFDTISDCGWPNSMVYSSAEALQQYHKMQAPLKSTEPVHDLTADAQTRSDKLDCPKWNDLQTVQEDVISVQHCIPQPRPYGATPPLAQWAYGTLLLKLAVHAAIQHSFKVGTNTE